MPVLHVSLEYGSCFPFVWDVWAFDFDKGLCVLNILLFDYLKGVTIISETEFGEIIPISYI